MRRRWWPAQVGGPSEGEARRRLAAADGDAGQRDPDARQVSLQRARLRRGPSPGRGRQPGSRDDRRPARAIKRPGVDRGRPLAPGENERNSYSSHNPTPTRNLVFDSWHSGGEQAIDVSDPSRPVQAGWSRRCRWTWLRTRTRRSPPGRTRTWCRSPSVRSRDRRCGRRSPDSPSPAPGCKPVGRPP
jgi:hypothetical protein